MESDKMQTDNNYLFFWGGECSQWYPSVFEEFGESFNCTEQFMMAAKAKVFGDENAYVKIMSTPIPKEQKALGRLVENFDPTVWDTVARDYVTLGNYDKFTQNHKLSLFLAENVDKFFVEASPYDKVWGIGLREDDTLVLDSANWKGKNWLGECINRAKDLIVDNGVAEIEMLRERLNWNK